MNKTVRLLLLFLCQLFWVSSFGFSVINFPSSYTLGVKAFKESDFEKAALHFQEAISIFKPPADSVNLGKCYLHLSKIHGKLFHIDKAKKYTHFAENIFENQDNDGLLIQVYNILGNIASLEKDYPTALDYYEKALYLVESTGELTMQNSLLNNIGVMHFDLKNYTKAIIYYKKALKIANVNHNKSDISLCLINIGISLHELNEIDTAIQYITNGIEKAKEINDLYSLYIAYEALADIYEKKGNFKETNSYLHLFIEAKEALSSIEINKEIATLEAKYTNQRKELEILTLKEERHSHEISALESEAKIKSLYNSLGISLVVFFIIAIAAISLFVLYKKKLSLAIALKKSKDEWEEKNIALVDALEVNTTLKNALKKDLNYLKQHAYRKQMNPHFIFNSLNSVQNYILSNDKLQANYYLGELATLIRRVLENSEQEEISLQEELFVCESYIKLEQKRFEDKFEYTITYDKNIKIATIKIPPLILQPFIENAIWHGLMHKEENALLTINVTTKDAATTHISIKDNGVGRSNKPKITKNGIKTASLGLNLTSNRIELMNKLDEIDSQITFTIIDLFNDNKQPNGTEVLIKIKKKNK